MMNEGYALRFDPEKYYGLKPKPISYVEAMKKREMAMDNALEDARERVLRAAGIGSRERRIQKNQQRDGEAGYQRPERNLDKILYRQIRTERLDSLETGTEERNGIRQNGKDGNDRECHRRHGVTDRRGKGCRQRN